MSQSCHKEERTRYTLYTDVRSIDLQNIRLMVFSPCYNFAINLMIVEILQLFIPCAESDKQITLACMCVSTD